MGRTDHDDVFDGDARNARRDARHPGEPWDFMLMLIEHGRRSRAARRARREHRAFRARLLAG